MPDMPLPPHFRQPALQRSYLLRLWRKDEKDAWRITLQGVEGESQIHFESAEHLLVYLRELLDTA